MVTVQSATLEEAARLWAAGRPLEAGRLLTSLVRPENRPRWAGRVLAWAYARGGVARMPEVEAVIAATAEGAGGERAAEVYAAIDAAFRREERSGRFDSLREAILTLARNAAGLLPDATRGGPEPQTGWWFVAGVKCVGDVADERFTADAWPVLARID
jgi:hypothetical protein